MPRIATLAPILSLVLLAASTVLAADRAPAPAAAWQFSDGFLGSDGGAWTAAIVGEVQTNQPGPRPPRHLDLPADNDAVGFTRSRGYLRVADPGASSPLDFAQGETISLEAWVNLREIRDNENIYVVGKGRTKPGGMNQNYALRLRGLGGSARVSLLFRSQGQDADWHRWNSGRGFSPGSGWHHVAVTYTFGKPDSVRGYLDGQPVDGAWDMGGPTTAAPVVDNDELWIGSSMGGSPSCSFSGLIDGVAIHRRALTAEEVAARWKIDPDAPAVPEIKLPQPPTGAALVQVFERVPTGDLFRPTSDPVSTFESPALGFDKLPRKYSAKGVIADWGQPVLLRSVARIELPAGEYELMLRSRDMARLRVDGKVVAQTAVIRRGGGAHNDVPPLKETDDPRLRPLPAAHQERRVAVKLNGGPHTFVLEGVCGTNGLRPELGELMAAISGSDGMFRILAPEREILLTESDWTRYCDERRQWRREFNAQQRAVRSKAEAAYWARRHEIAREMLAARKPAQVPPAPADLDVQNEIDHFIAAQLQASGLTPAPRLDDDAFLRRVALDTVGMIPTPEEREAFHQDTATGRRARAIDRYLDDPRWAGHWVSYWQDVFAENPNILKGKLNNTGPFRFWIHEALEDNRPLDRLITELVMMEGSVWYGGPAGFRLATQNDAPFAAKAHVVAKAALGVEMKCARCHDAPYHDVTQEDTFSLAAMLQRSGHKVPKTSVVPTVPGARPPEVVVALKPGQAIDPHWPFPEFLHDALPDGVVRNAGDTRERLAALVTGPTNERFAQVMVNRLWGKLLGRGLVEPVDDWQGATPSHPELLQWLGRELIASGYDAKHVVRLILNSRTYQQAVRTESTSSERKYFATPTRRRMTAEQLIDSLFLAAGKPFRSEPLTMDPDGRGRIDAFLNLGVPRRAWEMTSLSNERDRPALALPVAQSIVDVLKAFNWRESRPDPITERPNASTALQPAVLANGSVGRRIVGFSEESAWTQLALTADSPSQFVDRLFERALSRRPSDAERAAFTALLTPGFDQRIVAVADTGPRRTTQRHAVSWSNHLSAEATKIKLELERAARAGDPPTPRLQPDWRERAEDAVWALTNSPEFVFLP